MAKEYGLDPAAVLGLDPNADPLRTWQVRRMVFYAGRTVENRLKATRPTLRANPEDAPKGMHWSEEPMWTYRQAIGLDPAPEDADDLISEQGMAERASAQLPDVDADTAALLDGIAG